MIGLELEQIHEYINCLKRIVNKNPKFVIPEKGSYDKIDLKSKHFSFIVDVNRRGWKKPQFSLQLRNKAYKDQPLLRLDLIGAPHPNPKGDFPYAGQEIPCPHLHIAHPEYGDSIAYPLDSEYAKMYLTKEQLEDLVYVLKEFLKRCKMANVNDLEYEYQVDLL